MSTSAGKKTKARGVREPQRERAYVPTTALAKAVEFDAEFLAILLKRRLVVYEVPISYYGRSYGEGKKIKWYHTVLVVWNLVKYRFV